MKISAIDSQIGSVSTKNTNVNNLIAKIEKPIVSSNTLTKSLAQSARNNQPLIFNNHQRNSKNYSLSPNRQVQVSKKFLPDNNNIKKILILDLDEILVHSGFKPFKFSSYMVLKIDFEGKIHDIHVLIWPGANEFLEKIAAIYEIVICIYCIVD